jgi:hypothetical protein
MLFDFYLAKAQIANISAIVITLLLICFIIILDIFQKTPNVHKGKKIFYPVLVLFGVFILVKIILNFV